MKIFTIIGAVLASAVLPHPLGAVPAAEARTCPSAPAVVAALTKRSKLPAPKIAPSPKPRSYYTVSSATLHLERCASRSVIAHEYGHYVVDLASGGDFEEFKRIALRFTAGKNWLRTSEDLNGFERAAHCIGYALAMPGPYTKCPRAALRSHASEVLALARTRAPTFAASTRSGGSAAYHRN